MLYIHMRLLYEELEDPTEYYFELDDDGWENRRMEKYLDGRFEKAIGVAEGAIPSIEEINNSEGFEAKEIDDQTFNEIWDSQSDVECRDYRNARNEHPSRKRK